jgi:hypothetical protein
MAPRDDKGRKKSGLSITNIREGLWIIVIIILWYSAHSAHWQLAQQSQKYEFEVLKVINTNKKQQVSLTYCNELSFFL